MQYGVSVNDRGRSVVPFKKAVPNQDPFFFWGARRRGMGTASTSNLDPYGSHAWTYACVQRIIIPLTQLPHVLVNPKDSESEPLTEHPILDLFLQPNPIMSGDDLWYATYLALLTPTRYTPGGQVFWYLESGVRGQKVSLKRGDIPKEIWPYTDEIIKPRYGNVGGARVFNGWRMVINNVEVMQFEFDEIIRIRFINPSHPELGLSPYSAARIPIEQDTKSDEFNTRFFDNYGALGGLLTTENDVVDFEQLLQFKEQFEQEYTGSDAAGRVAVLAYGLKYDQFLKSNVDMQFMEQRKDNRLRIQAAYGVNEEEIGIYEKGMNRATAEQADRSVWQKTRLPLDRKVWMSVNIAWLRYVDNGRYRGKSDISNVEALQEYINDKVDNAKKLWEMGVPPAEALRKAGLDINSDAYPWLEKTFLPSNLIDAELLANGFVASPQPESPKKDARLVEANATIDNAVSAVNSMQRKWMWEQYCREVLDPGEKSLKSKVNKWMYGLRNEMQDNVDRWESAQRKSYIRQLIIDPELILFSEAQADTDLKNLYTPEVEAQMKRELRKLKQQYGIAIQWNVTQDGIDTFTQLRSKALRHIRSTMTKNSRRVVSQIISDAIDNNLTISETAHNLKTGLDAITNASLGRTTTIARTEIGSISSMSRQDAFKRSGIRKHEWLSAGDEKVRSGHFIDGQVRNVGELFTNGLKHPLDPDGKAYNVVNCRCVALAITED